MAHAAPLDPLLELATVHPYLAPDPDGGKHAPSYELVSPGPSNAERFRDFVDPHELHGNLLEVDVVGRRAECSFNFL